MVGMHSDAVVLSKSQSQLDRSATSIPVLFTSRQRHPDA